MKIDFVSDVACPWCAVGLGALEIALKNIGKDIPITINMQPFELNPDMAKEGVDASEYLMKKYGMSPQQLQAGRATLRERGAAVGFTFGDRSRVWNTFDAHRMLYWAGLEDAEEMKETQDAQNKSAPPSKQRALKHALLHAYHAEGRNPAAHDVLLALAMEVGLDADAARAVIETDAYTIPVREAEKFWQQSGISAVPSVVIDGKHLIQGGQPPEVFEQAISRIAAGRDE